MAGLAVALLIVTAMRQLAARMRGAEE